MESEHCHIVLHNLDIGIHLLQQCNALLRRGRNQRGAPVASQSVPLEWDINSTSENDMLLCPRAIVAANSIGSSVGTITGCPSS